MPSCCSSAVCLSNKAIDAVLGKVADAYGTNNAVEWAARVGFEESVTEIPFYVGGALTDAIDKQVVFTTLYQAGRLRGPKPKDGEQAPSMEQEKTAGNFETLSIDEASQVLDSAVIKVLQFLVIEF